MKLPRSEDIALLFMTELISVYPKGLISLSVVAKDHGLSVLFLKKLARKLKLAKLIISKEGVNGGYSLNKDPKQISVLDIFNAIESESRIVENSQILGNCPLTTNCLPQKLHQTVIDTLDKQLGKLYLNEILR
jgi:Rrf2 family transcriptional regulator, cysteine metabolism repressor